jgi:hypothetical protein
MKSIKAKNITNSTLAIFPQSPGYALVLKITKFSDTSTDYTVLTSKGLIDILWLPDNEEIQIIQ